MTYTHVETKLLKEWGTQKIIIFYKKALLNMAGKAETSCHDYYYYLWHCEFYTA